MLRSTNSIRLKESYAKWWECTASILDGLCLWLSITLPLPNPAQCQQPTDPSSVLERSPP
jgi:hypothetical protein